MINIEQQLANLSNKGEIMKTDLRIIKTKEALRSALLSVLKQKPLESISVSELCRVAKVNRGTFYLHYETVIALFAEYFREITLDLDKAYMEPYRFVQELDLAKLNPKRIKIFSHFDKYQSFYSIVFSPNVPMQYYYELFDTIKGLMQRNQYPEEITRQNIQIELSASYSANAIIGLVLHWFRDGFKLTVDEMNIQLLNILSASRTIKSTKAPKQAGEN